MNRFSSYPINFLLFAALMLFSLAQAAGQVKVTRYDSPAETGSRSGIVYNLPRTILDVEITVARTQVYPGPLAEYAREFLGVGEVVTKTTTEYQLKDACVKDFREPDPGQSYIIEKEEKSQGEVWVSMTPGGVIGLESFPKESSPKGFSQWDNGLFSLQDEEGLYPRYSASATREVIDTIIRRVSIDTLMIEEKMLKRSLVEYPNRDKAEEASDRIRRIESDMYNLLIGYQETAYTRESLEFMYNKLQAERQEYISLFTGLTVTENLVFHFRVIPDPAREQQEYLISGFSSSAGLIPADEQNKISLIISLENTPVPEPVEASGQVPSGIVYRTPVILPVRLEFQGRELASGYYGIMQFGHLLSLPATFKKAEIDLENGVVRSVVME